MCDVCRHMHEAAPNRPGGGITQVRYTMDLISCSAHRWMDWRGQWEGRPSRTDWCGRRGGEREAISRRRRGARDGPMTSLLHLASCMGQFCTAKCCWLKNIATWTRLVLYEMLPKRLAGSGHAGRRPVLLLSSMALLHVGRLRR